ncbi:MAG: sugar nucleotide-binding protein [Thermodesulfobacteriota bacterium]|nr:sugar nucleotide-binding protein [Thermodesulfobacteriota bacterium]
MKWAREQETLRIVDDQISSPTWARTLAEATAQVIAQGRGEPVEYIREKRGLYHLAGGGSCSRYEWAKAILEMDPHKEEQVVKSVIRDQSKSFPTPAKRPLYSYMGCVKLRENIHLMNHYWFECLQISMNKHEL